MANWNPKRDPQPEKTNVVRFKDFLKIKYQDKRFSSDNQCQDSSEEEPKKKKSKKDKKKKKVESSSDEDSEEIVTPARQV